MKMSKTARLLALTISVGCVWGSVAFAAPTDADRRAMGGSEAGVQMNRTREYLERQRVAKQIAEDRAKQHAELEDKRQEDKQEQGQAVKFTLSDIVVDESAVLTKEEVDACVTGYEGKEVTLADIYAAVNAINKLYAEKGFVTCKAYLPQQTIKKGVVRIALIEGRTGRVLVDGNNSTQTGYITDRIGLPKDGYSNLNELNRDLLHFNGTNDVQLRITMHAGQEPGTTDYVITAYEPQQVTWSLYSDNNGNENSGEWRQGIFFSNRSLTGSRDSLTLSGMRSDGTKSFSSMYSVPVGRSGTKLGLNYSANSVHMTDGELEDLDVRGHSTAYGVSVTQPIVVNEKVRTEAMVEYGRQNSQTDFLGIHWVDDTIDGYAASFAMTNYGDSSVVYQKHGYRFGDWENIDGKSRGFGKYVMNSFFQKAYLHGQMLSGRFDAQLGAANYLPSAEQFYIGGSYSVRGYEESLLGGDSGYSLSLEYAVPLDEAKKVNAFTFFDYGSVHGDSAFEDQSLAGTGLGMRANIGQHVYASCTLGIPLITELNGTEVDSTRIHFMVNGQF